ncbi:subtilisin protease [Melampsora larici-populina 98AG31]|uniref:Subtilisin protease n=1 Tax=Melampsora larici-populina (strain 98AG31 / pathotype 3-4-7) TaxID=747676 RepID=F4RTG6_MELLP|nr:subtilisin protease [Melampsora larici-populina 98AG31]EGG04252.1 subtilisin protease [Melampsora larici-populina 98AG31]
MRLTNAVSHSWTLLLAFPHLLSVIRSKEAVAFVNHIIVTLNPQESHSLEHFKIHLKELDISCTILQDYTKILPDVLYGVSMRVKSPADIAKLEASYHVVNVHKVKKILAARPTERRTLPSTLNLTSQAYPPHMQTGVTRLHELGHLGAGVKIAILDSVVDCHHPALGGGFGPGFKIAFGHDFVGDKYDGTNEPKADDNPCGACSAHGTHVTGIIGASNVGQGFSGVAPHATLGVYRVFGCNDQSATGDDIVVAALLRAQKDGANVISASIAGSGGWSRGSILEDTVNNLVEKKGATIIFAAGNSGEEGLFFGPSPGDAKHAISTGSVESTGIISATLMTSTGRELPYYTAEPFSDFSGKFPVYRTGNSTDIMTDACEPLPSTTPNLTNYVVLIRRGLTMQRQKVPIRYCFILLVKRFLSCQNSNSERTYGEYIFQQSKKDPTGFTVRFPTDQVKFLPGPGGGFMSNFSAYGPNFDLVNLHPDVSGVGGQVVSTFPRINGSYSSDSGTSMAAPQLAGIAALVQAARGKEVHGSAMRRRLVSTAQPVPNFSNTSSLQTVVQQGGGLVNAYCAVLSNTSVSASVITFNDTPRFNGTQTFRVTNHGPIPVHYVLSHHPASTAYTFAHACFPSILATSNCMKKANQECESHNIPYYGVVGSISHQKIIDHGPALNTTHKYHLPHLQFPAKDKKKTKIEKSGVILWNKTQHEELQIQHRANFGSPNIRLYVVKHVEHHTQAHQTKKSHSKKVSTKSIKNKEKKKQDRKPKHPSHEHKTSPHKKAKFAKKCSMGKKKYPHKSCHGVLILGEVPGVECTACYRSSVKRTWLDTWNGTISLGKGKPLKHVPHGEYRILIEALHSNSDPKDPESYDSWYSPVIVIHT